MAKANLRHRIEELERQQMSAQPSHSAQFDEDALTIYAGMSYLDATMEPTYHDIESTAIYARGKALRDALYGPIIPAHLDEHLKRYTRASGEFELAFGREPKAGDMLRYQHVALMHNPEVRLQHFDKLIEAWQRQFPHLTCPLKFEEGRLFRRVRAEGQGEAAKWEEDVRIQPEERWLRIPEVFANTEFDPDSEAVLTIPALVFLGVGGVKHQCGPATDEDLRRAEIESPIKAPAFFMYGRQRVCELLMEMFGACQQDNSPATVVGLECDQGSC